jgi:trimeric autotransporter adhesin
MPSTISWRGDAQAIAQVDTLTVGGTIEATDLFIMTIGNKSLSVAAGSTVAATVADNIVAAWNACTIPEFLEIVAAATSGGSFTLTAVVPGVPFSVSQSTTEANGSTSDGQTFGIAHSVGSEGPNDVGVAANYSTFTLPVDGDTLVLENSSSSLLYGLFSLSGVTLAELHVKQSFTGEVGLPRTHGSGDSAYIEYRQQYFQIGATVWDIGTGQGSGSGRLKFDFMSVQFTGTVFNSGVSAENYMQSVLLLGDHADNVLSVLKGTVGVAIFAGESANLNVLNMGFVDSPQGDSNVQLGDDVTVTTITKSGGILTVGSNITTFTQYDGTTTVSGTATVTTAIVGGMLVDQSSGTFTTVTLLSNGVYDHSRSLAAKTITTLTANAGSQYLDPYGKVTLTNGLTPQGCKPSEITIDVPVGTTLDF